MEHTQQATRRRPPLRGVVRLLGLAGAGLVSATVFGAPWHRVETLICSDCHTIHNSLDSAPMRYDAVVTPAEELLRAESPTHLCLACHDGSRPDTPDVTAPVSYLPDPAGGWFSESPIGQPNPNGHDLLSATPLVAPGGGDGFVLTCVSCHAPHGSDSHRNLLADPPGTGNAAPVTVSVTILAPGADPAGKYDPANLRYKSGVSRWCGDCHGDFHGRTASEEGIAEPWLRHPQDLPLSGAYGADYAHWSGSLEDRIPVESPTDDVVPSADDRVFCLSCHKAHGSAWPDALIHAGGATRLATCQQCHDQ